MPKVTQLRRKIAALCLEGQFMSCLYSVPLKRQRKGDRTCDPCPLSPGQQSHSPQRLRDYEVSLGSAMPGRDWPLLPLTCVQGYRQNFVSLCLSHLVQKVEVVRG